MRTSLSLPLFLFAVFFFNFYRNSSRGILTAINCKKNFSPTTCENIANINTLIKGGYVICTSVVPCLSSGFTKIDKVISMFVLFSLFFLAILKVQLSFSKNGETNLAQKQSNWMFVVNF